MALTETAQTNYNTGHADAVVAIALLEQQLGADAVARLARQAIIPIHRRTASWREIGQSDAWAQWQQAQRVAARRSGPPPVALPPAILDPVEAFTYAAVQVMPDRSVRIIVDTFDAVGALRAINADAVADYLAEAIRRGDVTVELRDEW